MLRNTLRGESAVLILTALLMVGMTSGSVQAGVIFGLLVDPTSTAGAGATSTRSGAGSWHLYAVDDSITDFGIAAYSVTMLDFSAINNRSPVTTITDVNDDPWPAGFSLLRSGTNANPVEASQEIPGLTPFLFTGFGQTASDFATKAATIQFGTSVTGPTISGSWGGPYTNDPRMPDWLASLGTSNVPVFLAEGLYSGAAPTIASSLAFVYSTANGTPVTTTTQNQVIPEPTSLGILSLAAIGLLVRRRR